MLLLEHASGEFEDDKFVFKHSFFGQIHHDYSRSSIPKDGKSMGDLYRSFRKGSLFSSKGNEKKKSVKTEAEL